MHLEDHIRDLHQRRESVEGLIGMARSIAAPEAIIAMLDARVDELTLTIEGVEEIDGVPRENRGAAGVQIIQSAAALEQLRADLGCRLDWHEPDEQDVNAYVQGNHLDNAMGSCSDPQRACGEFNVVITRDDKPVAVVNLAWLLAWAAEGAKPGEAHLHEDEDIPF